MACNIAETIYACCGPDGDVEVRSCEYSKYDCGNIDML